MILLCMCIYIYRNIRTICCYTHNTKWLVHYTHLHNTHINAFYILLCIMFTVGSYRPGIFLEKNSGEQIEFFEDRGGRTSIILKSILSLRYNSGGKTTFRGAFASFALPSKSIAIATKSFLKNILYSRTFAIWTPLDQTIIQMFWSSSCLDLKSQVSTLGPS